MIRRTWPVPLLLGAATLAALVVALAGDGWPDMASWAGLAAPAAAVAWAFTARRS
jgi:hypothetical protein